MKHKNILLHLSLIDGVGAATIAMLVHNQSTAIDLVDIYSMSISDLGYHFGLSLDQSTKIKEGLQDVSLLANELALIEKHSISWATILCDEYPALLSTIHMLPPVIYWRGEHIFNQKSIAIVGSRDANQYGKSIIQSLVPRLVESEYVIVSGGALGADALSHQAAIDAGGRTVVVLGSGLLKPNPPSNRKLFEHAIGCGGAMVSNFPLLMDPMPGNFPARNRIISGLSKGTVIIQAATKSGALITAHYAMEQGREVFAVPGSIYDELSAGCHNLIAQGAKLVKSGEDILVEFGEIVQTQQVAAPKKKPLKTHEIVIPLFENSVSTSNLQIPQDNRPTSVILGLCVKPCSTDDLVQKLAIDLATIQNMLFDLQLDGKISQNFMGMWQTK